MRRAHSYSIQMVYMSTPWKCVGGIELWLHAFLTLALDGGGVVSLTCRPLYPMRKRFRYPLNRRLCGPQSWSGRFGEEIAPVGIRTPGRTSCSVVTILTELFRLHHSSLTHGISWVHWLQKWQLVICIVYCVCLFVYPALLCASHMNVHLCSTL